VDYNDKRAYEWRVINEREGMHKNKWMIALVLLVLAGCKGTEDSKQALTQTKDNKHFTNQQFDLTVEKPEKWYTQSAEEALMLQAQGSTMLSGDDKNMKALLDASVKSTLTLFSFFELPPGTPDKNNPSVISTAEYILAYPGIKTGCDYLSSMKQLIARSQVQMQFDEGCQTEKLGGSTFGFVNATVAVGPDMLVHQRYWACRKGDHAIGVVQTFYDETSDKSTTDIIKTIQVKCDS
jgi:hypothetical protein